MSETLSELLRFRRCRDLHGQTIIPNIGRRNGKPAVFLRPDIEDPSPAPEPQEFSEDPRFYINLNPVERQTWRKLLAARSISSIADEEGVSRAAVYARIQGNAKGQGGMIGKNFWVLLWWRLRQRQMRGLSR